MKSEGQENINCKKMKGKRAYCVGKLHAISARQEGHAVCEGLEVRMKRFLNVMLNKFGFTLSKKVQ